MTTAPQSEDTIDKDNDGATSSITTSCAKSNEAAPIVRRPQRRKHLQQSTNNDPLASALTNARCALWKSPPRGMPWWLGPLREFLWDPILAITGILLPLLMRHPGRLNAWTARLVHWTHLPLIHLLYGNRSNQRSTANATSSTSRSMDRSALQQQAQDHPDQFLRSTARHTIRTNPKKTPTGGMTMMIACERPSNVKSAVMGVVSFSVSAVGDVVGAWANPKKVRTWRTALSQFYAYLERTGAAGELQRSILQPLWRGRLLDNLKMLNDIQEEHLCHNRITMAECTRDDDNKEQRLQDDLNEGHKWMRFATAAYGTEMIRSALDRNVETGSERVLHCVESAIAFHCSIDESDILLLYAGEKESDSTSDDDDHEHEQDDDDHHHQLYILHHFVAVDHTSKSIVLALRGTLSLSGAIVDVQGVPVEYCSAGQAHQGMAEMADNVWDESGPEILGILQQPEYEGYALVLTGHSLGGGTACLLTVKLHVEQLLQQGDDSDNQQRSIRCFAFAPPPTFLPDPPYCESSSAQDDEEVKAAQQQRRTAVEQAMENTVAYIHDNDVVPHLSIASVRRLTRLLDAVDRHNERVWFWNRWRIFYDYATVPPPLITAVVQAAATEKTKAEKSVPSRGRPNDDASPCDLMIPARVAVWLQHDYVKDTFQAFACDPTKVAQGHIFLAQDMLTDHLPEQYENALDALVATP